MINVVGDKSYRTTINMTTFEASDAYHKNLNGVYDAIADYAPGAA